MGKSIRFVIRRSGIRRVITSRAQQLLERKKGIPLF
jgi:hypothetical protein